MKDQLHWRIHTPQLLNEILGNPGASAAKIPVTILANRLGELAMCCAKTGNSDLIALCASLSLYSFSDPYDPEYDEKRTKEYLEEYFNKKK